MATKKVASRGAAKSARVSTKKKSARATVAPKQRKKAPATKRIAHATITPSEPTASPPSAAARVTSPARRESTVPRMIASGALAGTLATIPMTALMLGAQRLGLLGQMPPDKITKAALKAINVRLPKRLRAAATIANHFAFGATMGGLFGALGAAARAFVGRFPIAKGAAAGLAWGTLVWAGSYTGWVPALGIMPPPSRDRPGRPLSMVLAHWLYGGTLGTLVGAAQSRRQQPSARM